MAVTLNLTVNGASHRIETDDPEMPLLYALRNDLGLKGPRFGCGLAQCGACTVHVDGKSVRSCVYPSSQAAGKKITTLEGLGTPDKPHPVQKAFVEELAPQCGFCTPGQVMSACALLKKNPRPTRDEARVAMSGNLCRCGAYDNYLNGVMRAAAEVNA